MRERERLRRRGVALLLASVGWALATGCGSSDTTATGTTNACRSTVNGSASTSPSTGELVVAGTFYSNESLTVGYTLLGHAASVVGIAISDPSPSISFVGIPSGTQSFSFEITCTGPAPTYAALHSTFPDATITIK